jgi:hypothetical protein
MSTRLAFICILVPDWIIGSGLAAYLQQMGWNQNINDLYQAFFFLFVVSIIFNADSYVEMLAVLILLAGYIEDTLFYLLLRIWNPFGYELADQIIPPISGWLGWIGRRFGYDVHLDWPYVLALNLAAVFIVCLSWNWKAKK